MGSILKSMYNQRHHDIEIRARHFSKLKFRVWAKVCVLHGLCVKLGTLQTVVWLVWVLVRHITISRLVRLEKVKLGFS